MTEGVRQMRRGITLLAVGGAGLVLVAWLRTAEQAPLQRYLPLGLLLLAAYLAVSGLEQILRGIFAGRRATDAADRRVARRSAALGAAVLAVLLVLGIAAWRDRQPYWDAVKVLIEEDTATQSLRALGERHAARIEAGAQNKAALESWRTASTEAVPLRPAFERRHAAAVLLSDEGTGSLKTRAEQDAAYYALCLEWIDLYQLVLNDIQTLSMDSPADEWALKANAIVHRIHELPAPAPSQ